MGRIWIVVVVTAVLPTLFLGSKELPAKQIEQNEGIVVVRAYFTDKEMVNALAAWTEPWEVQYDKKYLVVEASPAEIERMETIGFRVEIDEPLTAKYNAPKREPTAPTSGIPNYACYRTVEETFAAAQKIADEHPALAAWIDAGDSWEKVTAGGDGYDMMVLRLTNSAISLPKPKLFIMSSVHAREYTPAELNTRFAEYMIANYGIDADVTWLLDYTELHLMLQANPDGRKHAENGEWWRKNTNENYCGVASSLRGADLNRNFPFHWGGAGAGTDACNTTYRGASAISEPETQAVVTYVRDNFADTRPDIITATAPISTTGIFLDIHSYSRLVLWPWGDSNTLPPNHTALQTLGRKFAYFNGYTPEQAVGLYPTSGTTDDFAYGELGLPAYTFELGNSFFEECAVFENEILPDNLNALLYAAKAVQRPYTIPAGPDALTVELSADHVVTGTAVTLTTTLDDTHYSSRNGTEPTQIIRAGEYSIDAPIWMTGTITGSLTAVDGAFDSTVEAVSSVIDTTALSLGRHIIYTRGQDADGNWGAVSATFLYSIDTTESYLYFPIVLRP